MAYIWPRQRIRCGVVRPVTASYVEMTLAALDLVRVLAAVPAWWSDTGVVWSGITPLVGGGGKADYLFAANDNGTGTKAYVGVSNGSNRLGIPSIWWNGTSWGYSGIKAYLK
jgi:hypothetical protein